MKQVSVPLWFLKCFQDEQACVRAALISKLYIADEVARSAFIVSHVAS